MKRISRRGFVVGGASIATVTAGACLCTGSGCATLTGTGSTPEVDPPAYRLSEGRLEIDLCKIAVLSAVGGSVKITDKNLPEPLIIVRQTTDDFLAVSIKCPHRGVEVEYKPEKQCFQCASLGSSKFKPDGKKISGFAREDLHSYTVKHDGNMIIITLPESEKNVAVTEK